VSAAPCYRHSGKARRGDGNDVTPNPVKLYATGKELRKLVCLISAMCPPGELPTTVRARTLREKNKYASRICRLKKKAQHEANKIKLYGLEQEHRMYALCNKYINLCVAVTSTYINQFLFLVYSMFSTLNMIAKTTANFLCIFTIFTVFKTDFGQCLHSAMRHFASFVATKEMCTGVDMTRYTCQNPYTVFQTLLSYDQLRAASLIGQNAVT